MGDGGRKGWGGWWRGKGSRVGGGGGKETGEW